MAKKLKVPLERCFLCRGESRYFVKPEMAHRRDWKKFFRWDGIWPMDLKDEIRTCPNCQGTGWELDPSPLTPEECIALKSYRLKEYPHS